ncbi:MAG: DHH family phosphoesterase [Bacteroidales bacterium]|nr:DHH family phosphoesterase [Bacteroidales bacterium]
MKDISTHKLERLERLIDGARRISIVTHMKPDGDAMGSSVAMYGFLRSCGKEDVKIVLPDRFPSNLDFITAGLPSGTILTHESGARAAEAAIASSDLVICLDFNAFHRADRLEKVLRSSSAAKVLIDHHLNPDRAPFAVSFSETEISSASELLYHVLTAMPQIGGDARRLPAESATALMTGMTTDTNNFANSTYPSTLEMASSLLAAGVDRDAILYNLYNRHSENRLRLMGHMMKDLLTITADGVAYIVLDRKTQLEYHVEEGDTEGFVNMPLSIESVKMSLLLKEDAGLVRVSVRSKKGISANMCARQHFNGGGHENAAGGRLYIPGDIADVTQAAAYVERHTHIFMTEEDEK